MELKRCWLPADQGGAPGKPTAHGFEQHKLTRLMRPSLTAVASASGTEAADVLPCSATVEIDLGGRDAQFTGGPVQNALVGLVRHEPVDVGDLQSRPLRRTP